MNKVVTKSSRLTGNIEVPGDKSISHRALILGSMCDGNLTIENLSSAIDVASTMSCLKQLGVKLNAGINSIEVQGCGLNGYQEPDNVLDSGNSGTTVRLLSGLLAGQPFHSVLTGDDSLRNRPMRRIMTPLQRMGANITARNQNRFLPMTIIGRNLQGIDYLMPVASAQVKTAILIAGMGSALTTTVTEKIQSRDHTEKMIKHFGGNISIDNLAISIRKSELSAKDIYVPGDFSSAVYFLAASILTPDSEISINNVGLNKTRTGFIDILKKMRANYKAVEADCKNEEPIGRITSASSTLQAIEIGEEIIPSLVDEIPLIALMATQADGTTIISGAEELRFKESDRLNTTAVQLNRLGASISEKPDGLIIKGPTPLKGAAVDASGDHRIAMTLAIAGLIADGETTIQNADVVGISFPEFFDLLDNLRNDK